MENKILNDQIKITPNSLDSESKEVLINEPFLEENINKQEEKIEKNILDLEDIAFVEKKEETQEIKNEIKEENTTTVKAPVVLDDKTIKEIEDILLKDGMDDFYKTLNIKNKEKFDKNLKTTSKKIKELLYNTKNTIAKIINKIFALINNLLKTLGIKDYGFLEKSVKNKVHEIIKLKKQ